MCMGRIKRNRYKIYGKVYCRKLKYWLNEEYENKQQVDWKTVSIISTILLYFIGILYISSLLGQFGISYELDFNIQDIITVLYEKALVHFFAINMYIYYLSIVIIPFILFYDKKKMKIFRDIKKKKWIGLLEIVFLTCFLSLILSLSYERKELSFWKLSPILIFFIFISYIWKFRERRYITLVLILSGLTYTSYRLGEIDARIIKKDKLTFNIILKDGTQILKEGDSCKYFIYKTDKNIYIYNEYIEEVEKYSTSEEFKSSFTFPNTKSKTLNNNTL